MGLAEILLPLGSELQLVHPPKTPSQSFLDQRTVTGLGSPATDICSGDIIPAFHISDRFRQLLLSRLRRSGKSEVCKSEIFPSQEASNMELKRVFIMTKSRMVFKYKGSQDHQNVENKSANSRLWLLPSNHLPPITTSPSNFDSNF